MKEKFWFTSTFTVEVSKMSELLTQIWSFSYRKNAKNSYVKNGQLHIATTLTSDEYGEDFIYNGELDLWQEGCRNEWDWGVGCVLSAGGDYIVNPVQSAKLISEGQFSFRFGLDY